MNGKYYGRLEMRWQEKQAARLEHIKEKKLERGKEHELDKNKRQTA